MVQVPAKAHTWVAGSSPYWSWCKRQPIDDSLFLSPLSSSLSMSVGEDFFLKCLWKADLDGIYYTLEGIKSKNDLSRTEQYYRKLICIYGRPSTSLV